MKCHWLATLHHIPCVHGISDGKDPFLITQTNISHITQIEIAAACAICGFNYPICIPTGILVGIVLPYSGKFSRGPIFAEGQSSKISRSNFHGWPFQNCSAHNTWLTPPITASACRLKNLDVGVLPCILQVRMLLSFRTNFFA